MTEFFEKIWFFQKNRRGGVSPPDAPEALPPHAPAEQGEVITHYELRIANYPVILPNALPV